MASAMKKKDHTLFKDKEGQYNKTHIAHNFFGGTSHSHREI